ncbi:MAG: arginine N-succinyltransferase, partial [Oleiphilaceae bacterium]|nr:arginine N-succinyltransferase [Oleiphilaceae bacterium]
MMLIRPIRGSDLEALYLLAKHAGVGVTTLPANAELLADRIELSEKSFAGHVPRKRANYMFALEDTATGKVVGVSAVEAYVGADDVWYNFRLSKCVNASKEIGVHTTNETLYLTNDLTGCSEVCSLFLDADYRHGLNGRLLSKCRFLFMREYPDLFSDKVIAEMRGYSDAQGRSPFWESLGRKFFQMDFSQADYLSGLGNKSFVAELMPKYPIYLAFLSEEAQHVVGEVHENTRPALQMLKSEGFNFNGFVDIFDA